jgi:predicted ATPase/class 3 adenylate cyclase
VSEGLERRLVAVMFTDMVGYTALLQEDERSALEKRQRYWDVLDDRHAGFGGTIVQRLGDGSMSMFPSSLAGVQAATAIQRELSAADVSVRIGIHVGEVIVEEERLTGEAVNIAARIESFAIPGGVMLSEAAYEQIKNRGDLSVVSLGRFRLKNVGRPFELYAVAGEGLVIPEPAALEGKGERFASLPNNLPNAGLLLGREGDLEPLMQLALTERIVTITGPGGVGKTTVLAELGRRLAPDFLDGVAFVPLADVADPLQVVPAIAEALDVKEAEGRTLGDGVVALIGDRKALLLLDNLEQVVAAAAELSLLVDRCPALRILCTSRTPLRIAAEREYALAPLALPPASPATPESLLAYPSVALFVERTGRSSGRLELTPDNADAVSAVCRRLDGLPLALELAAARLRLLSPQALLDRLDHALDVLTSGPRDVSARQQTLRATIDWSHSLLGEPEQRLFRRLAVFVGGCTLTDLEAICADQGESLLDELESLVDKALVQMDSRGDRLHMLQTIGEFAREQFEAAGETRALTLKHARNYVQRAREIRDGIEGADQVGSVERGIAEEGNLQAALETLLDTARGGDEGAAELGMQMCGDLWMYWHVRGKNVTANEYATSFLEAGTPGSPTLGRAGALITTGLAWWMLGDYQRSFDEFAEARRMASALGAQRELCVSGFMGALALLFLDPHEGVGWAQGSIGASRAADFAWGEAFAAAIAGILYAATAAPAEAETSYLDALAIQRRLGDQEGAGVSLGGLAQLAGARGATSQALDLYAQSLAAFEAVGDRSEEARILSEMAGAHLQNHDPALARKTFLESVRAHTEVASVRGVGLSLIGLAATEALEHRPESAVRIAAAAEVYAQQEGIAALYTDETPGRELVDGARAALSPADVERATAEGRGLTLHEALDLARLGSSARAAEDTAQSHTTGPEKTIVVP